MRDAPDNTFDPSVVAQLGRLDWIAQSIVDGLRQGLHRSTIRGFSTEFSDFQPYSPGDDIRQLDWRVYARTGKPYIRRFEAETSMEVTFVVDSSPSMGWQWEQTVNKRQYAASLVAGMAWLFLSQQDPVGLLKAEPDGVQVLSPSSRRQHLDHLLSVLGATPELGRPVIDELLQACLEMRSARGQVVVVSDFEEEAPDAGLRLAELRGMGHEVLVVHLLDQAEVTLPFPEGTTHLRDSETGELLRVDLAALRRRQAARVKEFRAQWRRVCREAGAAYVPLTTGVDYVTAILAVVESHNEAAMMGEEELA